MTGKNALVKTDATTQSIDTAVIKEGKALPATDKAKVQATAARQHNHQKEDKNLQNFLEQQQTRRLEESESSRQAREIEERRQAQEIIATKSKEYEEAIYQKTFDHQLGCYSEEHLESLNKKAVYSHLALIKAAGVNLSGEELQAIQLRAEQAASLRVLEVKRLSGQILQGIGNGHDLAMAMTTISKSEYGHLLAYFKANNGKDLWLHTEGKFDLIDLFGHKEAGRKAHSGEFCYAAEYKAKGCQLKIVETTKENAGKKIAMLTLCSVQNLTESAQIADSDSEFQQIAADIKDSLQRELSRIYKEAEGLGLDPASLMDLHKTVFSESINQNAKRVVADLTEKKSCEFYLHSKSNNDYFKGQAEVREEYSNKKISSFCNRLSGEITIDLSSVIAEAEESGHQRADILGGIASELRTASSYDAVLYRDGVQYKEKRGGDKEQLLRTIQRFGQENVSEYEIQLLSEMRLAESGKTLQQQCAIDLNKVQLEKALAVLNADRIQQVSCVLAEQLDKFWGPDSNVMSGIWQQYATLSDKEKYEVEKSLIDRGVLGNFNSLHDYVNRKLGHRDRILANTFLNQGISEEEQQAVTLVIELGNCKKPEDAGALLEQAIIEYDNATNQWKVNKERAFLIKEKFAAMNPGKSLPEQLKNQTHGRAWVKSLLDGEDIHKIHAAKYAYAVNHPDRIHLAISIFDANGSFLEVLTKDPQALKNYQKAALAHLKLVEQEYLKNYGGGLAENLKILAEYKSWLTRDAKDAKPADYLALHSAVEIKAGLSRKDPVMVRNALQICPTDVQGNRIKDKYKELFGKDLEKDLDRLKTKDVHMAKYLLAGDKAITGDPIKDAQNRLERAGWRLYIEERGGDFASVQRAELQKTFAQMKDDFEFIKNNIDSYQSHKLSAEKTKEYQKAVKRLDRDSRHFVVIADLHNRIHQEKAQKFVNTVTFAVSVAAIILIPIAFSALVALGIGSVFLATTSAYYLPALALTTAAIGFTARTVAKTHANGWRNYDLQDDLKEDLLNSGKEGLIVLGAGYVFKGAGFVWNWAASKYNFTWVKTLTGKAQRVAAKSFEPIVKDGQYIGSGFQSHLASNLETGYANVTKELLKDSSLKYAFAHHFKKATGKVLLGGAKDLERNIAQHLSLGKLDKVYRVAAQEVFGKKAASQLISNFRQANTAYMSHYLSSTPVLTKGFFESTKRVLTVAVPRAGAQVARGAFSGTMSGAAVGAALPAFDPETYDNGIKSTILRMYDGAVTGAKFGALIGGAFSLLGAISADIDRGLNRIGNRSRTGRWQHDSELLDASQIAQIKANAKKPWYVFGKSRFSSDKYRDSIDEILARNGDNRLFVGNLKEAIDKATLTTKWNLFDSWRIRYMRKVDRFEKNITPDRHNAYRDADLRVADALPMPKNFFSRKGHDLKLWWKTTARGNFRLTEHQVAKAQQAVSKLNAGGRLSKFDIMEFQRVSTLERQVADVFVKEYNFYVASNKPIGFVDTLKVTESTTRIWGRDHYWRHILFNGIKRFISGKPALVIPSPLPSPASGPFAEGLRRHIIRRQSFAPGFVRNPIPSASIKVNIKDLNHNYPLEAISAKPVPVVQSPTVPQSVFAESSLGKMITKFRKPITSIMAAANLFGAGAPMPRVATAADDLMLGKDRIELVVDAAKAPTQLSAVSDKMGVHAGGVRSQQNHIKLPTAKQAGDLIQTKNVKVIAKTDVTKASLSGLLQIDQIQVGHSHFQQHHNQILNQHQMIQQQLLQQEAVIANNADKAKSETARNSKSQQNSRQVREEDIGLPWLFSEQEKEKIKREEHDDYVKTAIHKLQMAELDETIRKAAGFNNRAFRKILITSGSKHTIAVQWLREDYQWVTLSERDVTTTGLDEPAPKVKT